MRNLSRVAPFLLLALPILPVKAADVLINEVAWMGTPSSHNDEWIELRNNTDQEINLAGWVLKTADGGIKISLSGKISRNGFYLLERTDDETVPGLAADQIYTGALGNEGERLELLDISGAMVDLADHQNGWAAGDNSTKQTMEKAGADEWQTSEKTGGTPRSQNSVAEDISQEVEKITESSAENCPQGVIFNEILPSPIGPDEENEWIEITNQNSFEVDLTDWTIEDLIGQTERYVFPDNEMISPGEYLIISRLATKITLNNTGDSLKLSCPDEKIIDSIDFGNAPNAKSYGLIDGYWQWISSPTPGIKNVAPVVGKEVINSTTTPEASLTEDIVKNDANLALSGISIIPRSYSFLLPLTISLAMAISAGTIMLAIKRSLRRK